MIRSCTNFFCDQVIPCKICYTKHLFTWHTYCLNHQIIICYMSKWNLLFDFAFQYARISTFSIDKLRYSSRGLSLSINILYVLLSDENNHMTTWFHERYCQTGWHIRRFFLLGVSHCFICIWDAGFWIVVCIRIIWRMN